MSKFNPIMAGLLLAGVGLAVAPMAQAAKAGARAEASPLQRCVSESWHKVYTRADADYELVRAHLETALGSPAPGARVLDPKRPPLGRLSFTVSIESRHCEQVPAGPGAWQAPVLPSVCTEVGCVDPLPGTTGREGSIMVIESCEGGKRTTAVYVRRNGSWVMVEYQQERSNDCGSSIDE